jgi:hypothetical protein
MDGIYRGGLLAALLVVLAGSLVAFGPVDHASGNVIRDRQTTAVVTDPAEHVGEAVVVSGAVVSLDPVRVRVTGSGVAELTVTSIDGTGLTTADHLYVFGTLAESDVVRASRVHRVAPWEEQYVLVVSLVGGLVLAGRLLRDWRFDSRKLAFVPARTRADGRDTHD